MFMRKENGEYVVAPPNYEGEKFSKAKEQVGKGKYAESYLPWRPGPPSKPKAETGPTKPKTPSDLTAEGMIEATVPAGLGGTIQKTVPDIQHMLEGLKDKPPEEVKKALGDLKNSLIEQLNRMGLSPDHIKDVFGSGPPTTQTIQRAAEFVYELSNPHRIHLLLEKIAKDDKIDTGVRHEIIDSFINAHQARANKTYEGYLSDYYTDLLHGFFTHPKLQNKEYVQKFMGSFGIDHPSFTSAEPATQRKMLGEFTASFMKWTSGKKTANAPGKLVHSKVLGMLKRMIK
jgi:hypothetical protein